MEDFHEISDQAYLEQIRSGNVTFIEVFCAKNILEKRCANDLAKAIGATSSATALELRNDNQEPEALLSLFEALSHCASLHALYLPIKGEHTLCDADVDALANIILKCNNLEILYMSSMKLTADQQSKILEACTESRSLKSLHIDGWKIKPQALLTLCLLIEKSSSLKKLNLHSNNLGPNELTVILKSLAKNNIRILDFLNLGDNPIGDVGLAAFSAYFQARKFTIKQLNLGFTDLSDNCADAVFAIINSNSLMEVFKLASNDLGDVALKKIAKALQDNDHLVELDLHGNNFYGNQQLAAVPNESEVVQPNKELFKNIELKLTENKRQCQQNQFQSPSKL